MAVVVVGGTVLALARAWAGGGAKQLPPPASAEFVFEVRSRTLARVGLDTVATDGRLDRAKLGAMVTRTLPPRVTFAVGRGRVRYQLDRDGALSAALRLGPKGGQVDVPSRFLSSRIAAPLVRQVKRNICEAAALEMLLAARGRRVNQLRLQGLLPRSGPIDPVGSGSERVWGDPELGYVGRPAGGGTAGGFGVYQGPVAQVANRLGIAVTDVSGGPAPEVYRQLARGIPVMVWIGLSEGPYARWRSPEGKRITVNLGEHTVLLAGILADGRLRVLNPLVGTLEYWTKQDFERKWDRLDRRALAA